MAGVTTLDKFCWAALSLSASGRGGTGGAFRCWAGICGICVVVGKEDRIGEGEGVDEAVVLEPKLVCLNFIKFTPPILLSGVSSALSTDFGEICIELNDGEVDGNGDRFCDCCGGCTNGGVCGGGLKALVGLFDVGGGVDEFSVDSLRLLPFSIYLKLISLYVL